MYIEKMREQILEQVKKDMGSPPIWGCGMQLKDIVGSSEVFAKIVCDDFEAGQTVQGCEKKIREYALKNKTNFGIEKAEEIIRAFFGLGSEKASEELPSKTKIISLADLL